METTERPLVHQPKTKTAFGSPKELAAAWKEFAAAKFKATDAEPNERNLKIWGILRDLEK